MAQNTEKTTGDDKVQSDTAPLVPKEKDEDMEAAHGDVLLEDDDFEEFEEENWDPSAPAGDEHLEWEDNWDDEEADDDFGKRLRAELAANPTTSDKS